MTCKRVDLPAPEEPTTATISPAAIVKSIPRRTSSTRPPWAYDLRSCRISTRLPGMKVAQCTAIDLDLKEKVACGNAVFSNVFAGRAGKKTSAACSRLALGVAQAVDGP